MPITKDSPKNDFLPPIGVRVGNFDKYKYDLIAVHIRYNRRAMDSFMKQGAKYITIIRDPGHQFESAFTHFQMDDAFLPQEKSTYQTMSERISHFLSKPDFYRGRLLEASWEGKKGLRWFYSKNNQMFDLGLDHKYHVDPGLVQAYVQKLDQEMALVLITEYFDESMVLLKHTLCWDLDDIVYIAKNVRPHPAQISDKLRDKIRQWNSVDTKLYDYFNKTLWRKIDEMGTYFETELAKFKKAMSDTFETCVGAEQVRAQGHYFHWVEYKVKQNSGALCKLLVESKRALFHAIWNKQSSQISKPKTPNKTAVAPKVPPKLAVAPKLPPKTVVAPKLPAKTAVAPKLPQSPNIAVPNKAIPMRSKPLPKVVQDHLLQPAQLLPKSMDTNSKSTQQIINKPVESVADDNSERETTKDVDAIKARFVINAVPKKPIQVKAAAALKKSRL